MFHAINWWYLPVALCELAVIAIKLLAYLFTFTAPLWLAAGIVGLI